MSSGLVALLGAEERAVVLAHERAHAHHRHDRYLYVASLATAFVPPLAALSARLRFSVERWADETAARACGDRRLVATTLGKVALHQHAHRHVHRHVRLPGAGFAGLGVPGRVKALLAPPVDLPGRPAVASLWVALAAVAAFSAYQLHHLEALVAALCPH
jgi:Zn-dependent protease with chaperone function